MKVAYVTMHFPAPSETFAATDVRVLHSLGASVDVYTMLPAHPQHRQLMRERGLDGVLVRNMTIGRALRGLGRAGVPTPAMMRWWCWVLARSWRQPLHLLKTLALAPAAAAIAADVRREGYDVVHLFWGHYPSLVGGWVVLQRLRPVLSMFLGAYDMQTGYGPSHDLTKKVDVVFTHASVNVESLVRRGVPRERLRVVHRGVPPELAQARGDAGPDRRPGFRVVTAGRLMAPKRMEDVIVAFSIVARRRPDAVLTVLGDGPEREQLRDRAAALGLADRVHFAGHQDHATVFREMARSQAFVLLSVKEDERLPNVVKEAMSQGCVPVVTRTPGIEELVEEGIHGFVVPAERPDVAAERIEQVLEGGARVEAMRVEARRRIEERFDARVSMRAYLEVWGKLATRIV